MNPLSVNWEGCIKFSRVMTTSDGNYLIIYLVQHVSDRGKKSHFTVKQYVEIEMEPYPINTEIVFNGYASENNYKNNNGQYQSKGLEITATEIRRKEVFE